MAENSSPQTFKDVGQIESPWVRGMGMGDRGEDPGAVRLFPMVAGENAGCLSSLLPNAMEAPVHRLNQKALGAGSGFGIRILLWGRWKPGRGIARGYSAQQLQVPSGKHHMPTGLSIDQHKWGGNKGKTNPGQLQSHSTHFPA